MKLAGIALGITTVALSCLVMADQPAHPELGGFPDVSSCEYNGSGCPAVCVTQHAGTITTHTNPLCFGLTPGAPPSPAEDKYLPMGGPPVVPDSTWSLPPSLMTGFAYALSHLLQNNSYQMQSKEVDDELKHYSDFLDDWNARLRRSYKAKRTEWQSLAAQYQQGLAPLQASLDATQAQAKSRASAIRQQLESSIRPPSDEALFLKSLLERSITVGKLDHGIPDAHQTPEGPLLHDTFAGAVGQGDGPNASGLARSIRRERARLASAPSGPARMRASRALAAAENEAKRNSLVGTSVARDLVDEARRARHEAEGYIRPTADPAARMRARLSEGFVNVQEIAGEARHVLDDSTVSAHLADPAKARLMDELDRMQVASQKGLRLEAVGAAAQYVVGASEDGARRILAFGEGVATGVYAGFYDTARALEVLVTEPMALDHAVAAIAGILEDPKTFLGSVRDTLVHFSNVMMTGTPEEQGHAVGYALSKVLIVAAGGEAVGPILSGAVTAAAQDLELTVVSRVLVEDIGYWNGETSRAIGAAYEAEVVAKTGGTGSFRVPYAEFDGKVGNRWWDAKAGRYWERIIANSDARAKFQSDVGRHLKIAQQHGATFEIFSQQAIPAEIKKWLTSKNVPFTEHF